LSRDFTNGFPLHNMHCLSAHNDFLASCSVSLHSIHKINKKRILKNTSLKSPHFSHY
jgi:hypothetical protein